MLLKDKTILVVGAGGLLGRQIVRSLVREGARVIAADRLLDLVKPLADEIGTDKIIPCQIDITDKASIQRVFELADASWKPLTGAVNTAYPRNENYGREALDVTYEDFCENVGLHLGGYFLFMQQCAVYSKAQGSDFSLVNLSSIYGSIAPRFDVYENTNMTMPVEYAAIKSAVQHTTNYFNAYMKGSRFRANCISPGGIFADQPPEFLKSYRDKCNVKGMLEPSDITGSVAYLMSDLSKYICGQNIIVDDGFSI